MEEVQNELTDMIVEHVDVQVRKEEQKNLVYMEKQEDGVAIVHKCSFLVYCLVSQNFCVVFAMASAKAKPWP